MPASIATGRSPRKVWFVERLPDTHQPVCFTTATSARTVAKATPGLLDLTSQILTPNPGQTLVVADAEHFNAEVVDDVHQRTGFDLLVPMPNQPAIRKGLESMPPEAFTRRWAGYATAKRPYQMKRGSGATYQQFVQRTGEQEDDWRFKAFLSTADRDEIDPLTSGSSAESVGRSAGGRPTSGRHPAGRAGPRAPGVDRIVAGLGPARPSGTRPPSAGLAGPLPAPHPAEEHQRCPHKSLRRHLVAAGLSSDDGWMPRCGRPR